MRTLVKHNIIATRVLAPDIKLLKIKAPLIAKNTSPGQFAILRVDEAGERIPLTLIDWNGDEGSITLVFKEVGLTTRKLGALSVGDEVHDLIGPLGTPVGTKYYGRVCVISGGVAIASAYPTAKELKDKGNHVTAIIGAQTAESLIFEQETKRVSDQLYVTTDDGSKGQKGFASDILQGLLQSGKRFDLVFAVGPVQMMNAVSEITKPYKMRTIASLNSLMVDGTGMCGCCRVTVGDKTMFTCVDGPEFDANLVDFNELISRLDMYRDE
jgi:ferredoxin--NADP+ reductase